MTADTTAALFGGSFAFLGMVAWLVLCIMLIISPLMIWKWARKTCEAVDALRASIVSLEKNLAAANALNLAELRHIRDATRPAKPHRTHVIPPIVQPPTATAVCPECGGVFEFDASVSEVDVVCPSCSKPFHIH